MRMCNFRTQNGPFALNKISLVQTIIITFVYLLALFIVQNFKIFLRQIQSYEDASIFFWKIINIILIYLLALFIVQNLKQIPVDPGLGVFAQFLSPKWLISPNENFIRKPVNEPRFFHSCLSTCQKSKSDINLLVKYWRLKNTEISLAESHFWL